MSTGSTEVFSKVTNESVLIFHLLLIIQPVATDCYDGSVVSKTPSLSELISSLTHNQKDFHMGPDPQLHQHIKVDQWCEVVRDSKLRSIEAGRCDPQETVNRKMGTLSNSGSPQSRRGAAMIPEPNRQRSEPPRIGKVSNGRFSKRN